MSSKLISPALRAALNLHSSKLPAATSQLASAHLSSAPSGGKHELPGLKYDYGALERKLHIQVVLRLEARDITLRSFTNPCRLVCHLIVNHMTEK